MPAWTYGKVAFGVASFASFVSFIVALAIDMRGAEHLWRGVNLPFPVIGVPHPPHHLQSDVATLCALVQTLALLVTCGRLQRAPLERWQWIISTVVASAACMLALAVPVLRSTDVYAYAGYTLLADPYHLQHEHFARGFRAVESLWSFPMIPSVYGPLWTALSRAATWHLPTLADRLYALRGLAFIGFIFASLVYARLRDPKSALVLFAANAGLINQYVVDAHNDLWGVAFVLLALLTPARVIIRICLLIAAGSIKLPLLVPAAVVFACFRSIWVRIFAPALAIVLTIVVALVLHADASRTVALQTGYRSLDLGIESVHYVLVLVCVALVGAALLFRRFVPFGGYTTLSLGINPNPWYLAWGFPYSIVAGRDRTFLVAFPIVASLGDSSYDATPLRLVLSVAIFAALLVLGMREVFQALRARRARSQGENQ
jgi:hypothetical protein